MSDICFCGSPTQLESCQLNWRQWAAGNNITQQKQAWSCLHPYPPQKHPTYSSGALQGQGGALSNLGPTGLLRARPTSLDKSTLQDLLAGCTARSSSHLSSRTCWPQLQPPQAADAARGPATPQLNKTHTHAHARILLRGLTTQLACGQKPFPLTPKPQTPQTEFALGIKTAGHGWQARRLSYTCALPRDAGAKKRGPAGAYGGGMLVQKRGGLSGRMAGAWSTPACSAPGARHTHPAPACACAGGRGGGPLASCSRRRGWWATAWSQRSPRSLRCPRCGRNPTAGGWKGGDKGG